MTGAVIVCLVSNQWNGTVFASEEERSSREAPSSQSQTYSSSETQPSTSAELAPATVIDEHPAGTTDLWSTLPQMGRSRFTLNAGDFAANPSLGPITPRPRGTLNLFPTRSSVFAGQVFQGRPYPMARDRHDESLAAIMIGSVIAITGAAILVYANRPECDYNRFAGGCGYGTKVIGGAVLSGGIVGLVVGTLTW
jgi:hypothetical protein